MPHDRQPTGSYGQKTDVVLKLMTEVMTKDLRSKGFETDGPQFEQGDGKTVVHLLNGERRARGCNDLPNFNSVKQFNSIAQEVEQHFGSLQDHIVLVFAETYDEGPADRVWPGHVARAVAHPPNGLVRIQVLVVDTGGNMTKVMRSDL